MTKRQKFSLQSAALTAIMLLTTGGPTSANELANGVASYSKGDYASARISLTAATQQNPGNWLGHYYLANTLVQLRQYEAAKAEYTRCMELNAPASYAAYCQKAISQMSGFKGSGGSSSAPTDSLTPSLKGGPAEGGISEAAKVRRAAIMAQAEKEAEKIRKEADEKIKDLEQNGNYWVKDEHGNEKLGVPDSVRKEIQSEAEAKAAEIIKRAERQAAGFR
ncbi:MAG TPA: tetratricopeptide repeat protein [Candidatus Obscuribacterales bacterium]